MRPLVTDLFAEFVGLVKADCLQSAVQDKFAVSLAQAHGGPERDGLSERMIHAVGDNKLHPGMRRGEGEREGILRSGFDHEDLRAGPWRERSGKFPINGQGNFFARCEIGPCGDGVGDWIFEEFDFGADVRSQFVEEGHDRFAAGDGGATVWCGSVEEAR